MVLATATHSTAVTVDLTVTQQSIVLVSRHVLPYGDRSSLVSEYGIRLIRRLPILYSMVVSIVSCGSPHRAGGPSGRYSYLYIVPLRFFTL